LPRRPPGELPPAAPPDVEDGVATREGVRVEGTPELAGLRGLTFYECDLDGLSLPGQRVALRLVDSVATRLDLANARFATLEVMRSTLGGSRLVGTAVAGTWRDVVVTDSLLDFASLRGCKAHRLELRACSLREADFGGAELDSVLLHTCDLTRAELGAACFRAGELVGCTLAGVRGVEGLRGVRMPLEDVVPIAPLLADALGIGLFDDPEAGRERR
jgi:uncharacterized protein YjbI with pentapeptide repeats